MIPSKHRRPWLGSTTVNWHWSLPGNRHWDSILPTDSIMASSQPHIGRPNLDSTCRPRQPGASTNLIRDSVQLPFYVLWILYPINGNRLIWTALITIEEMVLRD